MSFDRKLKKVLKICRSSGGGRKLFNITKNRMKNLISGYGETCYSQSGEDIIVSSLINMMKGREPVSYLDVGCNHPVCFNNTFLLRRKFPIRKGVLVEPNPELCGLIRKKRRNDIVLNMGIGTETGELLYYMMNADTLNTFSKKDADRAVANGYCVENCVNIQVLEINLFLKKYFPERKLDFLSIDTEGGEFETLTKIDYDFIRPAIICVETLEFMGGKDEKLHELIDFYRKRRYMVYADTWINTIFVDEWKINKH